MSLAPQELRTYFTTFSTARRKRLFQVVANAELMTSVLRHYRVQGRFALHAFVIMPDHLHVLLTPAPHVALEKAVQFIKGGFSFKLKSKQDVWERGHFDKRVPHREAYMACVTYIENNPVKARLVASPAEFAFSSAAHPEMVNPIPQWFA